MKKSSSSDGGDKDNNDNNDNEWTSLSKSIQHNEAKKKNLTLDTPYEFRVRAKVEGVPEWNSFLSTEVPLFCRDHLRMEPPTLVKSEAHALTVAWNTPPAGLEGGGYKLRYRAAGQYWTTIGAVISGTEVRKKNLVPHTSYFWSVSPAADSDHFSPSSVAMKTVELAILNPAFKNSLPASLLKISNNNNDGASSSVTVATESALARQTIALYFSASWCPPCRQFTPRLVDIYSQAKKEKLNFEVVFVSGDSDESEFLKYFHGHHTWHAIPYDDDNDVREKLQQHFKVTGVPRLVILGKDGKTIEHNAVGSVSIESVRRWCSGSGSNSSGGGGCCTSSGGGCC